MNALSPDDPTATPRVLVIGAGGFFGKLLVRELLAYTQCDIICAGRNLERLNAFCLEVEGEKVFPKRLSAKSADLRRPASLEAALVNVQAVICAAGPFQGLPLSLVQLCLARRIHYVDLADDRHFVAQVRKLIPVHADETFPAVCCGWSAVPALSGILTRLAARGFESIESIYIQIAPGNRVPRSAGTISSLLASVGSAFPLWRGGEWHWVRGWTEPRNFQFPDPVGCREGYLVDVPDHEIFPNLFFARNVECRVGSEVEAFNWMLTIPAWISGKGWVKDWRRLTGLAHGLLRCTEWIGHDTGAVGVEVEGTGKDGKRKHRRASVVADHQGHYIPVMPAVIMTSLLLSEQKNNTYHGLVSLDRWLGKEELEAECKRRKFRLVIENADSKASEE